MPEVKTIPGSDLDHSAAETGQQLAAVCGGTL
jgi:hypothetical protein